MVIVQPMRRLRQCDMRPAAIKCPDDDPGTAIDPVMNADNEATYSITDLAREFDVTTRTIRFTKTRAC